LKTRQHPGKVPAHFLLLTASELTNQLELKWAQVFWMEHRDLFDRSGDSRLHDRSVRKEPGKQHAE